MTEQEIIEGNKLIAEFMGWKFNPHDEKGDWMLNENGATFPFSAMKWHSSWDSLMPVVAKIHTLNSTGIAMHYEIEKQYSVVVSWIKHYNQNK